MREIYSINYMLKGGKVALGIFGFLKATGF